MSRATVFLQPAQSDDVPELAQIAARACEADRHTQLKSLPPNAYNHGQQMAELLETWISESDGTSEVLKAVETGGKIVGYVCWGRKGVSQQQRSQMGSPASHSRSQEPSQAAESGSPKEHGNSLPSKPQAVDPRLELGELTSQNMDEWMTQLMPVGCRCMFVKSIAVDPSAQGKGVGRMLVRHGTEAADDAGVFCWVHASEAGVPFFAREGFAEVGRLVVDLDHYAHESPPHGMGIERDGARRWGEYVFTYMKRDP